MILAESMFRGNQVGVVVPAYNETRLIEATLRGIPQFVDEICVVDDGSTDPTCQLVEAISDPRVTLIRHKVNRGVGGAITSGYRYFLNRPVQMVVVMGADNQMDPDELPSLLTPLIEDMADYVKGDRLSAPHAVRKMPVTRFLGNHLLSWLSRRCLGYDDIRDSQCGYTAITRQTLNRLNLDKLYTRYGFPNDILAALRCIDGRVVEVTVTPIYADEISGISLWTAVWRVPRVIWTASRRHRTDEKHGAALRMLRTAPQTDAKHKWQ